MPLSCILRGYVLEAALRVKFVLFKGGPPQVTIDPMPLRDPFHHPF